MTADGVTGESFEDLYENAPCGYLSTSPEGLITRVNETFLRMSGYRRDDVVGHTFEHLLAPGSQLYLHTQYQQALVLDGSVSEVALSLQHADGRTVPVVVNATMTREPDGTTGSVRTAVVDATKRLNYARALLDARRSAHGAEQRLRVLHEASIALSGVDLEAALVGAVSGLFRGALDATSAQLMMVTADTVVATDGGDAEHVVALDALWPRSNTTNAALVVTTAQLIETQPELALALTANRITNVVVCPVRDGDAVIALITSFFRRARDIDADEIELLGALGRFTAQALTRIRLESGSPTR